MSRRTKILIVDDKTANLLALEKTLAKVDCITVQALDGNQALAETLDHDFALAILDVQMPNMSGFELAELLRGDEKTKHLPIIFLTAAYLDDEHIFQGYESGAVDYITKPYVPAVLLAKVDIFLQLDRQRADLQQHRDQLAELVESLEDNLRQLRYSEERFRTVVQTVPDIVYRIDAAGHFVFVNKSVLGLGYEPEELIGCHFSKIVHAADIDRVSRAKVLPRYEGKNTGDADAPKLFDERRTQGRQTSSLEVRLKSKSGEVTIAGMLESIGDEFVTVEVNASGLWEHDPFSKQKVFVGSVGAIRDISERKRDQEHIRFQHALLEAQSEASPDGILVISENDEVIQSNGRFASIWRLKSDTLADSPGSAVLQQLEQLLAKGSVLEIANRIEDDAELGEQHFELTLRSGETLDCFNAPITDISDIGYGRVWYFRDVTQRKRAEADLTAANSELEAFAYSVSHDLVAPLRGIDGFAEILLEDYQDKLDDAGKDHLNRVRAATQRMGRLIDDLLELSRLTRAEMHHQTLDFGELARKIADGLQEDEPARQVDFDIAPGVIAHGDRVLLETVLDNLLRNAWKFTGQRDRARIEFGENEQNGERVYHIRDNGAGFDMAYADKLFGAFQRLHDASEFPGTGIGLAIVKRVILRHGGRIWAESEVDKGASFFFTVPTTHTKLDEESKR